MAFYQKTHSCEIGDGGTNSYGAPALIIHTVTVLTKATSTLSILKLVYPRETMTVNMTQTSSVQFVRHAGPHYAEKVLTSYP